MIESERGAARPAQGDAGAADPAALARVVERLREGRRIPLATYRLQFNRDFTFQMARELAPYLHALGVSEVYASPYLQASPESTHGYDIVNHHALNPAIGTLEEYEAFVADLRRLRLGQILDMVPNHMGIAANENRWWQDLLENGRSSRYARYFDVDWEPIRDSDLVAGRILLPVLGGPYGQVLESGELKLTYRDGAFWIDYWGRCFPLDPSSYALILQEVRDRLGDKLPEDDVRRLELESVTTAARNLPEHSQSDPARAAERSREKEVLKRRLDSLVRESREIAAALEATVAAYNGQPGDARSFDALDALLRQQAYRLAHWRVAAEEINYRRFFDVNELAGVRVEEAEVFRDTHRLVLRLLARGNLSGLRIDHPDGLWDPGGYLRDLQRGYVVALLREHLAPEGPEPDEDTVARWLAELRAAFPSPEEAETALRQPLYVVVEKILSHGERLPEDWPTDGTTGYDFANAVTGLFVDPANRRAFDEIYAAFIGRRIDYPDLANSSKKLLMRVAFPGDINQLAYLLKRIAARNRWYQDLTLNGLNFALREVIAALPRYRTYRRCEGGAIDPGDRAAIEAAIAEARRRNPQTARAVFQFIHDLLLLDHPESLPPEDYDPWCRFVMKFQQTTGPVMAKGVEDTAFYIFNRLVALNEVGGELSEFGTTVQSFHRQNAERLERWPHALLATSTHDTKRGEDVRARIAVLSELPREWRSALAHWHRLNRQHLTEHDGELLPDRNDEYLLYQTLLGAWPLAGDGGWGLGDGDSGGPPSPITPPASGYPPSPAFVERIKAYMLKAIKEAKVHTSWINANEVYETALANFVEAVLDPARSGAFLEALAPLQAKVAYFGMLNGLAQTLLKLTSPGVPDIYQGSELWNLNLVDPDNRQPVDYGRRAALLRALEAERGDPAGRGELAERLLREWPDGRVKLWLILETLDLRRRLPALFAAGDYRPLDATGLMRDHLVAFTRTLGHQQVLVAAPRLVALLARNALTVPVGAAIWGDTRLILPPDVGRPAYRNVLTGEAVAVADTAGQSAIAAADLFARFPVALLRREG